MSEDSVFLHKEMITSTNSKQDDIFDCYPGLLREREVKTIKGKKLILTTSCLNPLVNLCAVLHGDRLF